MIPKFLFRLSHRTSLITNEYFGDVTIPTHVIEYNQCCSRRISQSDSSIHSKLNYNNETKEKCLMLYTFK